MKILFIGQCEYGSTSRMRFEMLERYFNCSVELINTTPIIQKTWRPIRSIGWRFKFGPLIQAINKAVLDNCDWKTRYDLIWIEKGVFIKETTIKQLKKVTEKLVHFTPDPAFLYHKSNHFNKGLKHYDFCVTTKNFEIDIYRNKGAKNVIYCTQGYDENIHKPMVPFESKIYDLCFIGHYESEREDILTQLLNEGYSIALAGIKWNNFVKEKSNHKNLHYFGEHVAGDEYSLLIGKSKLGLGLLSKWIPEKHTTRTLEIPACGTLLVTEKNEETAAFFEDEDVIFFKEQKDIRFEIAKAFESQTIIKKKGEKGNLTVSNGNFSHRKIVFNILNQIFQ